jgi:hypothetical protein
MSFTDFVWLVIQKRRRRQMDNITLARCFRKVNVDKCYTRYTTNIFVVRMAEVLNGLVGDSGKISALILHVAVYFGNMFDCEDYQSRILKAFAQACYLHLNHCVSDLANCREPSDTTLNMMWLCSRRLYEVYDDWYNFQVQLCTLGRDVVLRCAHSIHRLTFSALDCVKHEYYKSAAYMVDAISKLVEINDGFYGIMVFEEHVDEALKAEMELHSGHEACFQSMGIRILRSIKLRYNANEYDEDDDKNRRMAAKLVTVVQDLCKLRSQSKWIKLWGDYHDVVERTKRSDEALEPTVDLIKYKVDVDAELAYARGLLEYMQWVFRR